MKTFLDEVGINIMTSLAGLLGSLLLVGKGAVQNLKQTFFAIISGVASANYITPIVSDLLKVENTNYQNGIAFILGFIGLKAVEMISDKIMKKIENGNNESN